MELKELLPLAPLRCLPMETSGNTLRSSSAINHLVVEISATALLNRHRHRRNGEDDDDDEGDNRDDHRHRNGNDGDHHRHYRHHQS